jgi:hypothetical protein
MRGSFSPVSIKGLLPIVKIAFPTRKHMSQSCLGLSTHPLYQWAAIVHHGGIGTSLPCFMDAVECRHA